jgi:hypothetical protein
MKSQRLLDVVNYKPQFHFSSLEYVLKTFSKFEAEKESAEMHQAYIQLDIGDESLTCCRGAYTAGVL